METRRIETVQIRLTTAERAQFGEAAALRRLSVSAFTRNCMDRGSRPCGCPAASRWACVLGGLSTAGPPV